MRIFVCEFVTGGGLVGVPLPAGLRREGDMMLGALVKDLAELPGVELVATRDSRLPDPGLPGDVIPISQASDPWTVWQTHIAETDATWPIAPETGGMLERLSALVLASGRILLGSRPPALRLAASKRGTAALLAAQGIAVVPTLALDCGLPPSTAGWVVKPDDGAGTEDTFLLRTAADMRRWRRGRQDPERFVVQPYLAGPATSLSLLCGDGRAALVSCNSQNVRLHGDRLRYHGGIVGRREDHRAVYGPIAARIAAAMPDLWGHVGIDLVDTEDGPVVLEINPRLTTSYAGLRPAFGINLAALVLKFLDCGLAGMTLPPLLREDPIRVDSDAG